VQKLSLGSVTNHLCALRFFYIQTLKKPWSFADTPYPKKRHRTSRSLPTPASTTDSRLHTLVGPCSTSVPTSVNFNTSASLIQFA
jgi:hypothetical protein